MTVYWRWSCVIFTNHAAKLGVNRISSRGLRGSRLTIHPKISKTGLKSLNNIMYGDRGSTKTPVSDVSRQQNDYLKKYEIGNEITTFYGKRELEHIAKEPSSSVSRSLISTPENQYDLLSEIINPLYKIPYEKQLQLKYKQCYNLMVSVGKQLKTEANLRMASDGLPCPVASVVPSPVTENYRNRDQFSIHCGVDGNPKTVGFFLESPSEFPDTLCINPDKLVIIKEEHKCLAKDFETYIRESPLPSMIYSSLEGFWKNIDIRSNKENDLMAVIAMDTQDLTTEQLQEEKCKLKEHFAKKVRNGYNLKSLYFQACYHTKGTHKTPPYELLFGDPYIYESISDLKFQLSPYSFFQPNVAAAELLLKSVSKLCKFSRSSVLLNLFCGSGSMSICFSPFVKRCIGIDTSPENIVDCKASAKLNNVENAEFYCGNVRNLVHGLLEDLYAEEVIIIVNSHRQRLSQKDFLMLRQYKYLKKIIFLSHKPERDIENYIELCKCNIGGLHIGKRFHPMMAVPIDMFPQTEYCELITLFQRL